MEADLKPHYSMSEFSGRSEHPTRRRTSCSPDEVASNAMLTFQFISTHPAMVRCATKELNLDSHILATSYPMWMAELRFTSASLHWQLSTRIRQCRRLARAGPGRNRRVAGGSLHRWGTRRCVERKSRQRANPRRCLREPGTSCGWAM